MALNLIIPKVISRGKRAEKSHSVVDRAAYHHRTQLADERTGTRAATTQKTRP